METKMKNQITYNVKTEIKPGVFEEYVEDDIEINQEYLAIPRDILVDQELKANEKMIMGFVITFTNNCLLYTSPSPRDATLSRMPSSA